ncbi:protein draper-like [Folsomia candida]|uniref:protein draper-like n=1 Tax=Folsomia candida TaxID=158441 RepID=UPI001605372F|nr:protein draper-like [Folsomia candida]
MKSHFLYDASNSAWILSLLTLGNLILVTTTAGSEDRDTKSHHHLIKQFLEPCDAVYTQVHCDDDDEDYNEASEAGCAPIETDDCDRSLQLYCHSGVCLPNCHPTLEDYDPVRGKCFRKIGANCTRGEECDLNAICERKHCRCAKNHTLEPESGKCVRSAEFGEFCDSDVICDMLGDVVCHNNTCQCRASESQFYHMKRKRCYLRVGQDCSNKHRSFQFCPDNSDCIRHLENGESERYIGIPGDTDEENKFTCLCDPGHISTSDGKACLGIYGTNCNSLRKCNTERSFKCYNSGTCQCARPKDQEFHEKLARCVTHIGSLCEAKKDICVDWAACKPDEDKRVSTCECISGYSSSSSSSDVETDKKVCLKDHGLDCEIGDPDNTDAANPRCNWSIGLECSNHTGTCQCKDYNMFYDVKLKRCRNFDVAQRRIPVTHYDTSDREYLFHAVNSHSPTILDAKFAFLATSFSIILVSFY